MQNAAVRSSHIEETAELRAGDSDDTAHRQLQEKIRLHAAKGAAKHSTWSYGVVPPASCCFRTGLTSPALRWTNFFVPSCAGPVICGRKARKTRSFHTNKGFKILCFNESLPAFFEAFLWIIVAALTLSDSTIFCSFITPFITRRKKGPSGAFLPPQKVPFYRICVPADPHKQKNPPAFWSRDLGPSGES